MDLEFTVPTPPRPPCTHEPTLPIYKPPLGGSDCLVRCGRCDNDYTSYYSISGLWSSVMARWSGSSWKRNSSGKRSFCILMVRQERTRKYSDKFKWNISYVLNILKSSSVDWWCSAINLSFCYFECCSKFILYGIFRIAANRWSYKFYYSRNNSGNKSKFTDWT